MNGVTGRMGHRRHLLRSILAIRDQGGLALHPEVEVYFDAQVTQAHAHQEADWVVPLRADMLLGRGHVGDGSIDFGWIRSLIRDAGYAGCNEVEMFNREIWDVPPPRRVATVVVGRHHGRRLTPCEKPNSAPGSKRGAARYHPAWCGPVLGTSRRSRRRRA